MIDNFAVFILTHGRPNNVITYKTLRRQGYTGPIYIIIDNEDKTADAYRRNYGEQVIVFDKLAVSKTFDQGDNFNDRRAVIYARNASFQIARDLGIEYFLQLDDDYSRIEYRFNDKHFYIPEQRAKNLDSLFGVVLEYYVKTPALTIALAQGGDFIGGAKSTSASTRWLKRKAMNSFFCCVRRQFSFFGRINEDVNTYVVLGNRGGLFLTFFDAAIKQKQTQQNVGGMTDLYLDTGTYVKSFYTVMYAPSCVTVRIMGNISPRLHHSITWDRAVPKIIGEQHRKTPVLLAGTGDGT